MKKILSGCAVVLVIAALGLACLVFSPTGPRRPMFEGAGDYAGAGQGDASLGDRISNSLRTPLPQQRAHPETRWSVSRRCRPSTRAKLGDRWDELKVKSESLRKRTADAVISRWPTSAPVFSDFTGAVPGREARAGGGAQRAEVLAEDTAGCAGPCTRRPGAAGPVASTSAIEELAAPGRPGRPEGAGDPLPTCRGQSQAGEAAHAKIQEWLPLAFLGL